MEKEKLTLGSHFTIKNILRQCASPIFMMLFISIYGMVDGLFVANFVGGDAFTGINLVMPIISIIGGSGFMFGSGGSALASKFLGEKKREDANKVFTMMIEFAFFLGILLSAVMFFFIDDLVLLLANIGADSTPKMIANATLYGRVLICSQPFFIVSTLFQNFFVVDEKQNVGFIFTLCSGVTNIIFDALFIIVFNWGVVGAAIATMMGHIIGSIGPIIYFNVSKNNLISFTHTRLDFKVIGKCSFNGLSDFIFNISANIIALIFNIQLLKYIGQIGVTAYGVIMYTSFIAISIDIGIAMGISPVISYNFGAKNHKELKNVIKNCFIILGVLSLSLFGLALGLARPLALLFTSDAETAALSEKALRIFSSAFLFSGFCIFVTAMFTALNDGLVSGLISLFRSFIFDILFVIILPLIFGADGIWWSFIAADFSSFIFCIIFYFLKKKKYNY